MIRFPPSLIISFQTQDYEPKKSRKVINMNNDYYQGCRIEIRFPVMEKALFEKVQDRIETQYSGTEVRGKETDKSGADMMISLVFIPKDHPLQTAKTTDAEDTKAPNPVGLLYDLAANLIDEVMEEAKTHV